MLPFLVPVLFTVYIQGVLKFKCETRVSKVKQVLEFFVNGRVLPKYVGENKELYWYIRCAYVGFINAKFSQNARNE